MKQTLEIDVPDGFEIERVKILDDCALVDFKKKQTKDFDYFVDQYLPSRDNSTSDEIIDWMDRDAVNRLNTYLKTKQFHLVPWEIKIGLFRFICDDFKYDLHTYLTYSNRFITETFMFIPQEFIDDLFK